MTDDWNETRMVAFLLGEDLGDVSELRGAMHRAFPKSGRGRTRRREPHLLSWGYQSNQMTGGSHERSYHIGSERGGGNRLGY